MDAEEMSKMLKLVVTLIERATTWKRDEPDAIPSYTTEVDGWKITLLRVPGIGEPFVYGGAAARAGLVIRLPAQIAESAWSVAEKAS